MAAFKTGDKSLYGSHGLRYLFLRPIGATTGLDQRISKGELLLKRIRISREFGRAGDWRSQPGMVVLLAL